MKKIEQAQVYLQEENVDGWLIYDFKRRNEPGCSFLEISTETKLTRRFFYFIPSRGDTIKIVHAVESTILDHLPGEKKVYFSWQSLQEHIRQTIKGYNRIALEYSFHCNLPYASLVDGGTIDLLRSFGVEIVSSAYYLPKFTSVLSEAQEKSLFYASGVVDAIASSTWEMLKKSLKSKQKITEIEIQSYIVQEFQKANCITQGKPIVAINEHSADPHFFPNQKKNKILKEGDFILIDLWCKERKEDAVFADITRVAVAANRPTVEQEKIFSIVKQAQNESLEFITKRLKAKQKVYGYEVDDVCRKVIKDAGYGEYFIHKTGHSIDRALHGSGAHLDNVETHDDRPLLLKSCFSIEPGIYLPGKFGVRLEYDLFIQDYDDVKIIGGQQKYVELLM